MSDHNENMDAGPQTLQLSLRDLGTNYDALHITLYDT